MPIYEYRCKNCGNSFDALRSFQSADEPIECTSCHKKESKRLLSTFFAHGQAKSSSSGSSFGCGNCSGGSCSSCGH